MKKLVVLLMALVFAASAMALYGCTGFSAGYQQGYKSVRVKKVIRPFAKKTVEGSKGKENIRVAKQPASFPKAVALVVKARVGAELPELNDEALAKIKETTIEWLSDNNYVVKDVAETPFSLIITLISYREGSLTGRILRTSARIGSVAEKDRAEINGQIMLLNGNEVLLDMDLPPMKTGEKGFTEGPSSTTVGMTTIRQFFAQIIIDTLNEYLEGKITPKQPS